MCGIIAVHSRQQPFNPQIIHEGLKTLNHRGPDEQDQWISSSGRVGLGHTRLSIIGLHNGRQPLVSEDQKIHAVVNGEFYGFEAIRSRLQGQGHTFRTDSDSEVLVHLYEEMGAQCVHQLRGEFAGILWDEKNQTLIAIRDRFGIKPLFYAIQEGQIYLASEAKALLAMGVKAQWDLETQYALHAGVNLPNRSIFAGIHSVPPGHYLVFNRGDFRLIPYWDFHYPTKAPAKAVLPFEEAVLQVRAKLQESVRLRLRSDVPVGVYLSGGIDSCTLLGVAAKMLDRPLNAFTLSFDVQDYDEKPIAQEMAKLAGAHFSAVDVTPQDFADNFEATVRTGEILITNTHAVAKFLLSRELQKAGYKVVLTGEGSDEIFGGYAPFKQDMILATQREAEGQHGSAGIGSTAQSLLEKLQSSNTVSRGVLLSTGGEVVPGMETLQKLLGFVPTHLQAFLQAGAKLKSLLNLNVFNDFLERDPILPLLNLMDVKNQMQGREPLHQSMYLWSKTMLPQYLLTVLGDRMEMAHSIEGRVPFLDHELVELLVSMPANYKIQGLVEKHLLKEAARPFITETVYKRQKHPFLAPPASVTPGNPLYDFVQDTLRDKSAAENIPFYNFSAILKFLDALPEMSPETRASVDPLLLMITSNIILQKSYRISM